jgi:2-oxoglutarate decarboxylase
MPHRGRLNVLANIVGKPYSQDLHGVRGQLNPCGRTAPVT